ETGQRGLRPEHFEAAIAEEFSEHEDLPNTTNPDEWARISGRKGERVTHLRMMHLDTTRGAPVVPNEAEISEGRPNCDLVEARAPPVRSGTGAGGQDSAAAPAAGRTSGDSGGDDAPADQGDEIERGGHDHETHRHGARLPAGTRDAAQHEPDEDGDRPHP